MIKEDPILRKVDDNQVDFLNSEPLLLELTRSQIKSIIFQLIYIFFVLQKAVNKDVFIIYRLPNDVVFSFFWIFCISFKGLTKCKLVFILLFLAQDFILTAFSLFGKNSCFTDRTFHDFKHLTDKDCGIQNFTVYLFTILIKIYVYVIAFVYFCRGFKSDDELEMEYRHGSNELDQLINP